MLHRVGHRPAAHTRCPSPRCSQRSCCLCFCRRRAHAMTDGFNALDGVTCTFTEGAM